MNVQLEKTTTGGGKKGSVIYVPKDPSEIYRIFTQQNKNCPPKDQVFLGKNGNLITFQGEPKVANHKVHGSFLWAFPPVPTQVRYALRELAYILCSCSWFVSCSN